MEGLVREYTCFLQPGLNNKGIDRFCVDNVSEARCVEVTTPRVDGDIVEIHIRLGGRKAHWTKPNISSSASLIHSQARILTIDP